MILFITNTKQYKALASKMDDICPGWKKDKYARKRIKQAARKMIKNENTTKHKAMD